MNPLTQFKRIRILPLLIVPALVALAAPPLVRADAVTDWNLIASNAIVLPAPAGAGQPPPVSALSFAMVHGAVYDAVNAIDRGHQPYLVQPPSNPTDSKEAATATAAYQVLIGLFPSQQPALQPQYDAYITSLPDDPPGSKAAGFAIGEATASAMLSARMNDGRFGPSPTPYPLAPGIWRPTPPNFATDPAPWVGNVRPFLMQSPSQFRTDGPNALTSAAYTEDFNEIKEVGSLYSTTRTADETDAAIFWQDHAHALFNRIFRTLAASQGLNIVDSARLFAMENLAAADAAIGCWNDKYYWQFWRPITAIQEADTDGNPDTQADPTWLPLFDPTTPVCNLPSLLHLKNWSSTRSHPRISRSITSIRSDDSDRCGAACGGSASTLNLIEQWPAIWRWEKSQQEGLNLSRSFSTVCEIYEVKLRNSATRHAKAE
jgi:hypothetical protein